MMQNPKIFSITLCEVQWYQMVSGFTDSTSSRRRMWILFAFKSQADVLRRPLRSQTNTRAFPTVPWWGCRRHAGEWEGLRVQREEPGKVEKHSGSCVRFGPAAPADADERYETFGLFKSLSLMYLCQSSGLANKSQLHAGAFTSALIYRFLVGWGERGGGEPC